MEQLSKQKAIEFHDSKIWEDWTYEQIAKFQLWQDRPCVPFNVFHEALEKSLVRPVGTHELGSNYEEIKKEFLHGQPAPTMKEIMELIPKDKRILIKT